MKRARKSFVWDHFISNGDNVHCKHCDCVLKYNTTTSTMIYHLKKVHPAVSGTGGFEQSTQPTITSVLAGKKVGAQKAQGITERICEMISNDLLPISVVEGRQYNIPSRATITSRLEDRYEKKKEELKMALSSVEKIALTTDCWTALTSESYITITCHYIDPEWQMKCAVLLTESLSDKHTSDRLAEKLNEAVASWDIAGRVIACVHDNAINIVAANDQTRVSWDSVPCFAHTLQLAINDGFNIYLNRVIASAGRLVSHFNHSTVATKALRDKQAQMKIPPHRLIQSCKTGIRSVTCLPGSWNKGGQ